MQGRDADPGRVVMLSGATGGIGLALAGSLLDAGFRVSAGVRDPAKLRALLPDVPAAQLAVHRHVAEEASTASSWAAATESIFGGVDALVNVAGVLEPFDLDDGDDEALDRMWAVNAKGCVHTVKAAVPALRRRGGGHIVNVASLSGLRPGRTGMGYAMTKAAVVSFTHQIRLRLWAEGIRCTVVCPGAVDTDMIAGIRDPSIEPTHPEDVARSVLYLLNLGGNASVAVLPINCRAESLW